MTLILLCIAMGIVLILAEIFVVPGIGVVGVIGIICLFAGVYFAYELDEITGHYTLAGTLAAFIGLTFIAFRSNTWSRMMVKSELKAKVNTLEEGEVKVGDEGLTVSRLAPMGKARINGKIREVKSFSQFIEENIAIQVTRLDGNIIIVKTKPNNS